MVLFFQQEQLDLLGIQETLFTEAADQIRFGLAQKNLTWHNGSRGLSTFQEKLRTDMECLQGFSVNDDTTQILVLRLLSIDTLIVVEAFDRVSEVSSNVDFTEQIYSQTVEAFA